MSNPLKLTRSQLASFLNNDQDLIRRFEELFIDIDDTFPGALDGLELSLSSAESKANSLEKNLKRISQALEAIALQPAKQVIIESTDNLVPRAIIPKQKGYTGTYINTDTETLTIENGLIVSKA